MPLPSTRISLLNDAGNEDPKDKFQLQRQVLGVWTDYHSNFETYYGGIRTVVHDVLINDIGTLPPIDADGKYLVILGGSIVFTPGMTPSNDAFQVLLYRNISTYELFGEMVDGATAGAVILNPFNDSQETLQEDVGFNVQIANGIGLGPYSGRVRITVQYVLVNPI